MRLSIVATLSAVLAMTVSAAPVAAVANVSDATLVRRSQPGNVRYLCLVVQPAQYEADSAPTTGLYLPGQQLGWRLRNCKLPEWRLRLSAGVVVSYQSQSFRLVYQASECLKNITTDLVSPNSQGGAFGSAGADKGAECHALMWVQCKGC